MKQLRKISALLTALMLVMIGFFGCNRASMMGPGSADDPIVVIETSMGNIFLQIYAKQAPNGTENFLAYVNEGFYNGTIFHRVIDGFMVQGGGYDSSLNKRKTREPIVNEATNGLRNLRGTVAYARTTDVHSATAQFFINLQNNRSLDQISTTDRGFGYAVFGKVVRGMAIVDKIAQVRTTKRKGMSDVPVVPVFINDAYLFEQ